MTRQCNLCGLREDTVDLVRKNKTWCLVYDKEVDNKLSGCGYWQPTTSTISNQKVQIANEIKRRIAPEISQIERGKEFNTTMTKKLSKKDNEIWSEIEKEYELTKRAFGIKINFVSDKFVREIIFRDVSQAYMLAKIGFPKPAVILAGSVIEELLRLYLRHKKISVSNKTFDGYIKACKDNDLLKSAVYSLTDAVRHFRNYVHLAKEKNKKNTISVATAKGAVSSIFTLANDFD